MANAYTAGINKNRKVSAGEKRTNGKSNNKRVIQNDNTKRTSEDTSSIDSSITANEKHVLTKSSNRYKNTIENIEAAAGAEKSSNRNSRMNNRSKH